MTLDFQAIRKTKKYPLKKTRSAIRGTHHLDHPAGIISKEKHTAIGNHRESLRDASNLARVRPLYI